MKTIKKAQSVESVLTLRESRSRTKHPKACMVLNTKKGTLWYQKKRSLVQVDTVDAEFRENEGEAGDLGAVSAWISLLGGSQFVFPFVSTVEDPPPGEPSHIDCVEIGTSMDNSILVLKFLEPPKDKIFYYPKLYFFTTDGVIDPTIIIRRVPPA